MQATLLKKENIPPGTRWKMGHIEEVYPGKANIIRVVLVRTAQGSFKRPISKLVILPKFDAQSESAHPIYKNSNDDNIIYSPSTNSVIIIRSNLSFTSVQTDRPIYHTIIHATFIRVHHYN